MTKILIAEDNPVDALLLQRLVEKWGYDAVLATDGQKALWLLRQPDSPHLVILDWVMPGLDGLQVCREVKASSRSESVHILLLTGRNSTQDLVTALAAGSDDYVSKPFHPDELRARLQAAERILEAKQRLVKENEILRKEVAHDTLTGIPNRAAVLKFAQAELTRSRRQGTSLGLALADIDHFKALNDTYGHLAGDAALKQVARTIQSSVRAYDCVGRYGGEEFLIVLPDCDTARALVRAEHIRKAVEAVPVAIPLGISAVTISVGVTAGPAANLTELLAAADEGLYKAKNNGRNQVSSGPVQSEANMGSHETQFNRSSAAGENPHSRATERSTR